MTDEQRNKQGQTLAEVLCGDEHGYPPLCEDHKRLAERIKDEFLAPLRDERKPSCLWCRDTGIVNSGTAHEGRCHRCSTGELVELRAELDRERQHSAALMVQHIREHETRREMRERKNERIRALRAENERLTREVELETEQGERSHDTMQQAVLELTAENERLTREVEQLRQLGAQILLAKLTRPEDDRG